MSAPKPNTSIVIAPSLLNLISFQSQRLYEPTHMQWEHKMTMRFIVFSAALHFQNKLLLPASSHNADKLMKILLMLPPSQGWNWRWRVRILPDSDADLITMPGVLWYDSQNSSRAKPVYHTPSLQNNHNHLHTERRFSRDSVLLMK